MSSGYTGISLSVCLPLCPCVYKILVSVASSYCSLHITMYIKYKFIINDEETILSDSERFLLN